MEYKVFWCRVNKYYTDKWLNSAYLQDKSWVFVASCVVTDKAKRKWIKFVKQVLAYLWDNEKVYISWCWAFERGSANEKFFEVYSELSIFKDKIEVLPEDPEEYKKNKEIKIDLTKLKKLTQIYTKKFIVIQGWCDSHCSFCLTVLKRWKHFFRSKEDILEEILDFEKWGWKEIVITWVNLWAWWLENTNIYKISKLSEILEYILDNSLIQRIRISSIWPEYIDDKLIEFFSNPRILPFFHLSIQSGSTKVLKEMRRHYDRPHLENVLSKLNNIKRPEWIKISIWADLIVGFPGETEAEFLDTFNLVRDYKISKLHAFPFSAHTFWEKVPASDYSNQVDDKTKKDRLDRLISLWNDVREEFITSQMEVVHEVLIETVKKDDFTGQTKNYIDVTKDNFEIISWTLEKNSIVTWKITKLLSLENESLNSEG